MGFYYVDERRVRFAIIPLTVRKVLAARWDKAGRPTEGCVWTAPIRSGHVEPSSIRKQHKNALKVSKVKPFVLYSLRHTFLTRLGLSGCDLFTLMRVAGHSSAQISARYVHSNDDAVLKAMERLPEVKPVRGRLTQIIHSRSSFSFRDGLLPLSVPCCR